MKIRYGQILLATFAFWIFTQPTAKAESPTDQSILTKNDNKDSKAKKKDKKKKKKKDKQKNKNRDQSVEKSSEQDGGDQARKNTNKIIANAEVTPAPPPPPQQLEPEPAKAANGDWCEWLSDNPGRLYSDKANPWFQSFIINGSFQYQAAYQDGTDMYDRDFHDTYSEYRRFRLETRTKFAGFLTAEFDVNLVDDNRFKNPPDNDLHWGYNDFDTAIIEADFIKAFDNIPLDELKLAYGKMKMPITEEQRQSSKEIYTIERSLLSNKLGGEENRPTGVLLETAKGDWSGRIGFFSGEDDADFIGAWNDGFTQFYSLAWQPDAAFNITLDYVNSHRSGSDDALGYDSAVALGSTYDNKTWGVQSTLIYGDNGYGDPLDSVRNRANRTGDFYGASVMPWYWLVQDRLQLVCRLEYVRAMENEGLQLTSRYIRAQHDDPLLAVNNGRGDHYNACYLGLNYYLCGDNAKIMGGILYESTAVTNTYTVNQPGPNPTVSDHGKIKAFTYMIAFRTAF